MWSWTKKQGINSYSERRTIKHWRLDDHLKRITRSITSRKVVEVCDLRFNSAIQEKEENKIKIKIKTSRSGNAQLTNQNPVHQKDKQRGSGIANPSLTSSGTSTPPLKISFPLRPNTWIRKDLSVLMFEIHFHRPPTMRKLILTVLMCHHFGRSQPITQQQCRWPQHALRWQWQVVIREKGREVLR